jgi:chemotaxis protein methyltransferase WspC
MEPGDPLARLERALRDEIGLDVTTVGRSLVRQSAIRRMTACGAASLDAYATYVLTDSSELQELVEAVVVPETYFFREPEALAALVALVRRGMLPMAPDEPLRVLSAPCSTGEEPYSIAMTLLESGVPAGAIAVDGLDVSREAVRLARRAVYGRGSVRRDLGTFARHFATTGDGLALREEITRLVRLRTGNVLALEALVPAHYHVVFCRNLLIYLDDEGQARALGQLARILAPGGVLFLGAADTFAARRAGFVPMGGDFTFAHQHRPASDAAPAATVSRGPRVRRAGHAASTRGASPATSTATARRMPPAEPAVAAAPPSSAPSLADIARLANAGRLEEAARFAERLWAESEPTADLLALLGTTRAALGDVAFPEECYRRALYLDPTHPDALLHLALLLQTRGDHGGAMRLRSRARRAAYGRVE